MGPWITWPAPRLSSPPSPAAALPCPGSVLPPWQALCFQWLSQLSSLQSPSSPGGDEDWVNDIEVAKFGLYTFSSEYCNPVKLAIGAIHPINATVLVKLITCKSGKSTEVKCAENLWYMEGPLPRSQSSWLFPLELSGIQNSICPFSRISTSGFGSALLIL